MDCPGSGSFCVNKNASRPQWDRTLTKLTCLAAQPRGAAFEEFCVVSIRLNPFDIAKAQLPQIEYPCWSGP